jgi:hypothetical protein
MRYLVRDYELLGSEMERLYAAKLDYADLLNAPGDSEF